MPNSQGSLFPEGDKSSNLTPEHRIMVAPATSLAITEIATPALSTITVDYQPVDNHRALLNRWHAIPLAQRWVGGISLTLGLAFIGWVTSYQSVTPFLPFVIHHRQAINLAQIALGRLHHQLGGLSGNPNASQLSYMGSTTPVSAVQPQLRPIMVDRFYLAENPNLLGQESEPQPAIIMDRYYFDSRSFSSSHTANAREEVQSVDAAVPLPLRVPTPPPSIEALGNVQALSSRAQLYSAQPVSSSASASQPPATITYSQPEAAPASGQSAQQNRLIGVIQTGDFSAALVQTANNSYAVKPGDQLSQSVFSVVEVQANSVIFSNGRERFTVHVGDSF